MVYCTVYWAHDFFIGGEIWHRVARWKWDGESYSWHYAYGRKSKYKYQYAVSLTVKNIMIAGIVYTGYSTLNSGAINRFQKKSASSLVWLAFERELN